MVDRIRATTEQALGGHEGYISIACQCMYIYIHVYAYMSIFLFQATLSRGADWINSKTAQRREGHRDWTLPGGLPQFIRVCTETRVI